MAAAAQDSASVQPLRLSYIYTGAIVEGIPARGPFKSQGKYWLTVDIDGSVAWKTREVRTKGSMIAWEAKEDRRPFECASTSRIQVVLCKSHSSGKVEELGAVEQPLDAWLQATEATPLVPNRTLRLKSPITITLFLMRESKTSDAIPTDDDRLHQTIQTAAAGTDAMRTVAGVDRVEGASEKLDGAAHPVANIGSAWGALLDNVAWFMIAMDAVTEVHPYAKMAWSVLSAAYKVVDAQRKRGDNVRRLVEKMQDVYAFLREAQEMLAITQQPGRDKLREKALADLASQTVECAHFITTYAKDPSFVGRLAKQSTSGINETINKYSKSFDALKQDFRDGSRIRMEITTFRIVDDIKNLSLGMDIRQIPYAPGAGWQESKQCLGDTRAMLLDEIASWANTTVEGNARLFVLLGQAGTGKSTVAHTIASRFHRMKRLGASFCFSAQTKARTPTALFRNLARDLAAFHPTYRTALGNAIADGDADLCNTEDIMRQFEKFILEPAQKLAVNGTILIMIDALDESGTFQERKTLLRIIRDRLKELPPTFRFLITSRIEVDIREIFSNSTEDIKVRPMPTLQDDPQLAQDILKYIRHSLSEGETLLPGLSEQRCVTLTFKSHGIFQWAAVACRYITNRGKPGETPAMRYQRLVDRADTGHDTGLDEIYVAVLSLLYLDDGEHKHAPVDLEYDPLRNFRTVMGIVLTAAEPLCCDSLNALVAFLLPRASFDLHDFLQSLGSLLHGAGERSTPVRPLHSSFAELLRNPERSNIYYIGAVSGHHENLVKASLHLLTAQLHFNMGDLNTSYRLNRDYRSPGRLQDKVKEDLRYACRRWGYHLSACAADLEGKQGIIELLRQLFLKKFLFWLDAASIAGVLSDVANCIKVAMRQLQRLDDEVYEMAEDGLRVIRLCSAVIMESAPHTYMSTLVWTPMDSKIAEVYGDAYPWIARVTSGRPPIWPIVSRPIHGHLGFVTSIAFSADGRRLASTSTDHTIRMWDAETGMSMGKPFIGHDSCVSSVAFSPDGMRIVSGSNDRSVRIWNVETGAAIGEPLLGHSKWVNSVAFSPDGRWIVSGSDDGSIRMWDAKTGAALGDPLTGHNHWVNSVAFSPDGKQIASGSRDSTIWIWDAKTRSQICDPLTDLDHRFESNSTLQIWNTEARAPTTDHLDFGSALEMWTVETRLPTEVSFLGDDTWFHSVAVSGELLSGRDGGVLCIAFSTDGKSVVSGSKDGNIRIWDLQMRETRGEPLIGHSGWINSVAFSPDGRWIASGSVDRTIRIWDAKTGLALGEPLKGHDDAVSSVAFLPDGRRLASGSADGTIRFWDVDPGAGMGQPLTGHIAWVRTVAFSPDSRRLASSSDDKTIRIWDVETGAALGDPLGGHYAEIYSAAFSPDGRRIASGGNDGTVRIWDAQAGARLGQPLKGHAAWVRSVAFSPDGSRIASGSEDRTIRIWDVETGMPMGEPLTGHTAEVHSVAFSPDGKWIASGSSDNTIRTWDAKARTERGMPITGHERRVTSVAFSPDGHSIVSGSGDKTVCMWDVATGAAKWGPFMGHTHWVNSVAFSPCGTRIVSGSSDGTIRMWDADTGAMIGDPLKCHDSFITTVSFSPNGRWIASGSNDGTIRIWHAEIDEPLDKETRSLEPAKILSLQQPPKASRDPPFRVWSQKRFALSPWPSHQLMQPYVFDSKQASCLSLDRKTGWIMGNNTDHILWIPPHLLNRLSMGVLELLIPGPAIHIDLSHFVHGSRWTDCRLPLP